ncbi:hypothetical protein CR513_24441, partial [Mucuna pruriens]
MQGRPLLLYSTVSEKAINSVVVQETLERKLLISSTSKVILSKSSGGGKNRSSHQASFMEIELARRMSSNNKAEYEVLIVGLDLALESLFVLDEIHIGICGMHIRGRSMETQVLKVEYYWSTL